MCLKIKLEKSHPCMSCIPSWIVLYGAAFFISAFSIHPSDASIGSISLGPIRIPRSSARDASCANKDISQCTDMLEVLTKKDIGFAASQEQLTQLCPLLLKGLACIDNYTNNCLNEEHRRYFNELYAGTIKVIKDLCDAKGFYQNEYLKHAPCMREVNEKYDECSDVYHDKTSKLNEVNSASARFTEDDRRKSVITLCCSFQEYLECSERIVYETCGGDTAEFTRNFLHRMAGPIVQTKCSRYEPGSMVCLTAAGNSTFSTIGTWTLVMFLAGLHRYLTNWLIAG